MIEKSIEELAPLIQNRDLSPVELTDAVLTQIDTYNGRLNAYIEVTHHKARETAKQAEQEITKGHYRGKLHGIPMALKDNIYFKNQEVTMGSKIHQHFVPDYDATVVKNLKNAGVIFTGKLNLHEYAWGGTTKNPYFGATLNPWNPERIPGGSSGGSAVAVASDMSFASLGTDTVGSVRIPAAACGVVGLKPTYGRISKYGCFPSAWSMDHVGTLTKTVEDAAILLDMLDGFDEKDPASVAYRGDRAVNTSTLDIGTLKIGVNEEFLFRNADQGIERLVWEGIQGLTQLGVTEESINLPNLQYAEYAQMITLMSEASTIHHRNLKERPQDFGEDIRLKLEMGEIPSAVEYLQAQQMRRQIKLDFENAFKKVDVIISPTFPLPLPKSTQEQEDFNDIRFTGPANLTGLPAITIPFGISNGMPVGIQLIGKAFEEKTLLQLALALEKLNPVKGEKPNLNLLL